ncbi:hypothetical protein PSC71_05050 [Devosia sp. J2-20]|uniref:hypothetical protein n=1 Tax=Devosia sp. J2-20 TaxID=3026161 RepID=UPI00249B8722|nr:hypothetical protein [Devosia sp. J2-20]WDR00154.1 hypothetical protein PSC71_05050 [Devosia sp. J2-20]
MNPYFKGGLAALALAVSAMPAAAEPVAFTLINNSSQSVHFFYTTPSNEDNWGADVLGENGTIEPDTMGTVTIGDGSDECFYDFRFESAEGGVLDVREVDICSLSEYTLTDAQ